MHLSPPPPGGLGCCPFYDGDSVVVDSLFILAPVFVGGGVCVWSLFCYLILCFISFAIILMGKRELVDLL